MSVETEDSMSTNFPPLNDLAAFDGRTESPRDVTSFMTLSSKRLVSLLMTSSALCHLIYLQYTPTCGRPLASSTATYSCAPPLVYDASKANATALGDGTCCQVRVCQIEALDVEHCIGATSDQGISGIQASLLARQQPTLI